MTKPTRPPDTGLPGIGPVNMLALRTAVPAHRVEQAAVRRLALDLFPDATALAPVFANAGIGCRYSAMPLDWYRRPVRWAERNRLFIDHASTLLARCAADVLAAAGLSAGAVDCLVVVSSSGIATPSLDARLAGLLPFRQDVQRLPVFGLGCAGGVIGLSRAAALARASPGARVLFLVVELCGLTFRAEDRSRSNVIATALFGDGVAGAVLQTGADPALPTLTASGEHLWPGSLDIMGWRITDTGLGVLFSRDIPTLVREGFGPPIDHFLGKHGLGRGDLAGTVFHPGGQKVLEALASLPGLPANGLRASRKVLRDYGNMSAATVLFVLREVLDDPAPGLYLMAAPGPGFTLGFQLLQVS